MDTIRKILYFLIQNKMIPGFLVNVIKNARLIRIWFVARHLSPYHQGQYWFRLTPAKDELPDWPRDRYFQNIYLERISDCVLEINPSFYNIADSWLTHQIACVMRYINFWYFLVYLLCSSDKLKASIGKYLPRYCPNVKVHLFTFENTSYEAEICRYLKDSSIISMGYAHSIFEYNHVPDRQSPDVLLSSSRYFSDDLRSRGYKGRIIDTYNIRQRLVDHGKRYVDRMNILVLFPIYEDMTDELLSYVIDLAQFNKGFLFHLKFHPWMDKRLNIPANLSAQLLPCDNLQSAFLSYGFTLYIGGSTTILEAMCYGHQLIKYVPPSGPEEDNIRSELRGRIKEVGSADEFVAVMGVNPEKKILISNDAKLSTYLFNSDIPQDHFWKCVDNIINEGI